MGCRSQAARRFSLGGEGEDKAAKKGCLDTMAKRGVKDRENERAQSMLSPGLSAVPARAMGKRGRRRSPQSGVARAVPALVSAQAVCNKHSGTAIALSPMFYVNISSCYCLLVFGP